MIEVFTQEEAKGFRPRKGFTLFSVVFQDGSVYFVRCTAEDKILPAMDMVCQRHGVLSADYWFICRGFRIDENATTVSARIIHRTQVDAMKYKPNH